MKKNIFIIIIIWFLHLAFCSNAKKKLEKNLGTISFTAQDLQIVPYKGGEQLTFIDSLSGVIQLQVDSPTKGMQKEPEGNGAQYDYYMAETEYIDLRSFF